MLCCGNVAVQDPHMHARGVLICLKTNPAVICQARSNNGRKTWSQKKMQYAVAEMESKAGKLKT